MAKSLDICEGWVLDFLHLTTDEAYKQEAINLSGSYTERIRNLGRSLASFHNLLSLDLSRNMLNSLKGLDHLKLLRCLNLYFNEISTIKELYRLRSNKQLREIDLRLNPVTKEEPHSRLFLVYMLPHLRQLDDRCVNEQERGAALLHFSSDQAHNFSFNSPEENERSYEILVSSVPPQTHPRVKMVQNAFPQSHSALDEDDVTLLNLLSKCHLDAPTSTMSHSEHVLIGNSFTKVEEEVSLRLNFNSTLGRMFGRFLKDLSNALRRHLPETVRVAFLEDFNGILDFMLLEFSEKEEEILTKEKKLKNDCTILEEELEVAEGEKRELLNKLREVLNENSNLRVMENEVFPLKAALSQIKEENILLHEKIHVQESHIEDMSGRILSKDKDRVILEKSIEEKRVQFEDSCISIKEIKCLAAMLQETHQSLVINNSALLQENSEMKERHEQEINQLHLSYQQIRKSFDIWRETNKHLY